MIHDALAPSSRILGQPWLFGIMLALTIMPILGSTTTYGAEAERFCATMRQLDAATLTMFASEQATPEQIDVAATKMAQAYADSASTLTTVVPDEIKVELGTVLGTYKDKAQGNKNAFISAGFRDANERLMEWLETTCHMTLTDDE